MSNKTEIRYLSPVDIEKRKQNKYCRFKKMGIKYIDYKDPDFLMRFLNEQGKILPKSKSWIWKKLSHSFWKGNSCN